MMKQVRRVMEQHPMRHGRVKTLSGVRLEKESSVRPLLFRFFITY